MLHRLLTNGSIKWWDRIAHVLTLLLLLAASFYGGHLSARIDEVDRATAARILATDTRWEEDHRMLAEINAVKEQRTIVLQDYNVRLARIEALILRRK